MKALLTLVLFLVFAACDTMPSKIEEPPVVPVVVKPTATPAPAIKLAWNNAAWDKALFEKISASSLPDLNPTDIKEWCPTYASLSREQKIQMWAVLAVAIIKRESGYNPNSSMIESDGSASEGFFQLTYGNKFCPKNKTEANIRDPYVNMSCGVKLMAYHVAMDNVVAAGGYVKYGAPSPKGLARYWSVARVPDTKSKHHKAELQSATKAFCK